MKKFWYSFGPMITIMTISSLVIGTSTALLVFYKYMSEGMSFVVEVVLSIPIALCICIDKYDPQERWKSFPGDEQ